MNVKRKAILVAVVIISTGVGLVCANKSLTSKEKHSEAGHQHAETEKVDEHHDEVMSVNLSAQQIQKYDIQALKIDSSHFQQKLSIPGEVILNENNVTHVVASVPGIVKDIYKNLGESVEKGEHLVSIKSQEMAEAKASYLAAYKDIELKADLFKREEKLWNMRVRAEIEFLKIKNIVETARIQLEQAKQKLLALGITEEEIKKLPQEKGPLNLYYIDSPIKGTIIERHLTKGELIDKDKQIYVLADLNTVWVNLAVTAKDLHNIKKGQKVNITSHDDKANTISEVIYVSPMINEESRSGRAIVELDNSGDKWHPGDFIKAEIAIPGGTETLTIPMGAVQKINDESFVFVRNAEGFLAKKVSTRDIKSNDVIQINEGLEIGDEIAITNAFLLKAELGKKEAEHSH